MVGMIKIVLTGKKGVADFGYDFYLLAIAKLLHGQYFRLLDFYFHTLIQQRRKKKVSNSLSWREMLKTVKLIIVNLCISFY
jgi:hypothetical protein